MTFEQTLKWDASFDWSMPVEAHKVRVQKSLQRALALVKDEEALADCTSDKDLLESPELYARLLEHVRQKKAGSEQVAECLQSFLDGYRAFKAKRMGFGSFGERERIPQGLFFIDFESPLAFYQITPEERPIRHRKADEELIRGKIAEALQLIQEVNEDCHAFVLRITRTVICREQLDFSYFRSSSQNTHVGRITLSNAHIESVTAVDLASALVHETIHSYLYTIEEESRFIPKVEDRYETIRSPWTGNSICLHSFIHACFVWYGLYFFWSCHDKSQRTDRIEEELAVSKRGFLTRLFQDILEEHKTAIRPDILQKISKMALTLTQH